MPKKRTSKAKTVYRTRTKTIRAYASRAKNKIGGALAGFVAGAGGTLAGKYIPYLGQWTQPAADLVTGSMMNNDTLMTIGGRSIGAMLASGMPGTSGTGNSNPLVG